MFILDSDILIWILREGRGNKVVFKAIEGAISASTEQPLLSTITVAEIYQNIKSAETDKTEQIFKQFSIIPVTTEIAKAAGYYRQEFHQKFQELNLADCLIAATAKDQKAILLSLNTRHFPMKDIDIINPLKT